MISRNVTVGDRSLGSGATAGCGERKPGKHDPEAEDGPGEGGPSVADAGVAEDGPGEEGSSAADAGEATAGPGERGPAGDAPGEGGPAEGATGWSRPAWRSCVHVPCTSVLGATSDSGSESGASRS